jgi:hypothetical protein
LRFPLHVVVSLLAMLLAFACILPSSVPRTEVGYRTRKPRRSCVEHATIKVFDISSVVSRPRSRSVLPSNTFPRQYKKVHRPGESQAMQYHSLTSTESLPCFQERLSHQPGYGHNTYVHAAEISNPRPRRPRTHHQAQAQHLLPVTPNTSTVYSVTCSGTAAKVGRTYLHRVSNPSTPWYPRETNLSE